MGQSALGILVEASVLNSHSDLVANGGEQLDILVGELTVATSDGEQSAQHLPLRDQRHASQGAEPFLPDHHAGEPRVCRGIPHHQGLAGLDHVAGEAFAYPQPIYLLNEPRAEPSLGGDGQHPIIFFIQEIDSPSFDLHDLQRLVQGVVQDLIQIQGLAHRGSDGVQGRHLFGPVSHPLLEVSVRFLEMRSHAVELLGQFLDLISRPGADRLAEIASSHLLGGADELRDRLCDPPDAKCNDESRYHHTQHQQQQQEALVASNATGQRSPGLLADETPRRARHRSEAGDDVPTLHIAGAQRAHLSSQHLLHCRLAGEAIPNQVGVRMVNRPPRAVNQIGAAALAYTKPGNVAVEGIDRGCAQTKHAGYQSQELPVVSLDGHANDDGLRSLRSVSHDVREDRPWRTQHVAEVGAIGPVLPQDLWPLRLCGHDRTLIAEDKHATVEDLKAASGPHQYVTLDDQIALVSIGNRRQATQKTGVFGEEASVFCQACRELPCREAGQFLVPYDDQVFCHPLVGAEGDPGYCGEDDGSGHKGPGEDFVAEAPPSDSEQHD